MNFFALILTSLSLVGSVVVASPAVPVELANREVAESIVNATALGVDIYGPIPNDAVQKAPGEWIAEPGTKAWAWIRAQIDIDPSASSAKRDELEQRQVWANIGIGMFAGDWCTGQAGWFDNVQYGVQHFASVNMFSVGISYRGLRSNEKLDFSKRAGNDWCGQYAYTAGQNTPIGCFNSQLINCFRLTTV